MVCKKCGKEIREGNEFCTNCGYSVNGIKKNKLKEYKIPIIIICIFILIIGIVLGIKVITNRIDNNKTNSINNEVNSNTNILENEESTLEEKVYITQDSDVSPTGKEFIGLFSERFKEVYEASMNICDFVTYNTSIENIKQYTQEHRLKNNITGNMDIVEERAYYYNSLNNKFIGSYIKINNIKEQSQATINNGYTLEEYLDMVINLSSVIFQNAYNGSGDEDAILKSEEYFNYANSIEEIKSNTFDYKNCTYTYIIKGCDMLTSVKTFKNDSNKMEVLLLAYDENSDPEEVIKNWYDKVTTLNEEKEDVEQQEELNDDEASTNKQENSNNSNSEDKQTSNSNNQNANNSSNSNSDNDEEEYEDTSVMLTHKQLENKTEQQLKNLLTSNGLIPKVVSKTEEIAYSDDLANTTKSTVELQLGNGGSNYYYKGDTVEIINTYYKPISWTANLYYNVGSASFNVFGKTCYAYSGYSDKNYGVFCFRENPTELDTFDLLHGGGARGVKLYINDEHIGDGKGYYEFTFNNVETITFKVVAPYVYEYNEDGSERTVLGTDVVVYEKKLNVKELYKNMSGDTIELKIK